MIKKILKILSMGLFLLMLLLFLWKGIIEFIRIDIPKDIVDFSYSFYYLFSIIILSISLFKNKNTKVFFLGFLPVVIFFLMVIREYIVMSTIVVNIGFLGQFLMLKKKPISLGSLLFFVSLLFVLFLFPYSCEVRYRHATDVSSTWNWDKMKCEVSSGWGNPSWDEFAYIYTTHSGSFYRYSYQCPSESPFMEFSFDEDAGFIVNEQAEKCEGCDLDKEMLIAEGHEKDFDICSNRETIQRDGHFYSILKKENK